MDTVNRDYLVQRFLSGTISEPEAATLLSLLEHDPEFRVRVDEQREIEFLLTLADKIQDSTIRASKTDALRRAPSPLWDLYAASAASPEFPLDTDELIRLAALSPSLPNPKPVETPLPTPHRKPVVPFRKPTSSDKKNYSFRFAALSLLVLFAFLIYWEYQPKPENVEPLTAETALARITRVAEPVFPEDALVFKPGQGVDDETIRLESGSLELETADGVRIVLEGPATFNIQSAEATFCRLGRVSVEVPKGAEGFEVRTPFANVRDLGTAFVVDVSETESAVHVVSGKVAVDKLLDVWTPVVEGVGRVIDAAKQEKQIKADKSMFVAAETMQRTARRYEKECLEHWNERRSRYADDPALLLDLDFHRLNRSRGVTDIIGTKKVVGRWPEKSGVAFSKASDTIRLSVPHRLKSFTLIASVCLNDLSRASSPIFSVGDMERGALHWQINERGELQLLIGTKDRERLADFASGSILSPLQFGVWMSPATVVDAKTRTITHYLDGRKVASLPWKEPIEIDFSESELGRWPRRDRSPTARRFNGSIDEFVLLGRALSEEEICTIFQ